MNRPARGFTFIELVIAIVVIGIAVSGVLLVMNETTQHSADPMITHQEIAVAQAYLEEILVKSYTSNGVEGSRDQYDDVCDYNGLNEAPTDQTGTAIGALGSYNVTVAVNGGSCGGTAEFLNGTTPAELVTVTVTGPNNTSIALTGYRTNY